MLRIGNAAEAECARCLTEEGWTVYKRGWPNFLAVKAGQLRLIEVKACTLPRLKVRQSMIAKQFESKGLKVEIWTRPSSPLSDDKGKGRDGVDSVSSGGSFRDSKRVNSEVSKNVEKRLLAVNDEIARDEDGMVIDLIPHVNIDSAPPSSKPQVTHP